MIIFSININDKDKLHNKLFIIFLLWCCPESGKVQEGLTFVSFLAEDYLFTHPFNKYLVRDYNVFMPGNATMGMTYVILFL